MALSDVFGGWGWGLGPGGDFAWKMQREIKWKHTENTARQLAKLMVKTEDLHDYKLKPCVGNRRQYQAASTQPHFFTITRCAFPLQARALVIDGSVTHKIGATVTVIIHELLTATCGHPVWKPSLHTMLKLFTARVCPARRRNSPHPFLLLNF